MILHNFFVKTLKPKLLTGKNFLIFLSRRAQSDTILRVAASLSYTSLIALVPLLAIGLAVFSAFPAFSNMREQLQTLILQNVMPNIGQEINVYFNSFVSATAKLTAVGIAGIVVTAILLLSTIENSLNFIFKVYKPRSIKTKITLYWTVITLGPLLFGTGFSLRGYIFALQKFMPETLVSSQMFFSTVIPSIFTILSLVLLYVMVPNKKVGIGHAFVGAILATALFYILRQAFAAFLISTNTYNVLYGALAIVPIMLVWLYLNWVVVIFGAALTAALDEFFETTPVKQRELKVFDYQTPHRNKKNKHFSKKFLPKEQK